MPGFSFLLLKLRGVASQAHCGLLAYVTQPCVHIIPLIDQLRALKKGLLTKCFGVLSVFGGGKLLFQKLPSSRETGGDSWQGEWRHCNPMWWSQTHPCEGRAKFGEKTWMSAGKGRTTRPKYGNFAVYWFSSRGDEKWIIFWEVFENYQTSTIFKIKTFRRIMFRKENSDRLAIKVYRQWSLLS